jgi:hypothetical protein
MLRIVGHANNLSAVTATLRADVGALRAGQEVLPVGLELNHNVI